MTTSARGIACSLFLFAYIALPGCGGSDAGPRTIVKGKLTYNGKPFSLVESKISLPKGATAPPPGGENGIVRIAFILAEGKEQFPATYHAETATFEVLGPDGKGIQPGRYKIAITVGYTPVGNVKCDGKTSGDYFDGKFSRERTTIIREVTAGEEIIIDVAKPQG